MRLPSSPFLHMLNLVLVTSPPDLCRQGAARVAKALIAIANPLRITNRAWILPDAMDSIVWQGNCSMVFNRVRDTKRGNIATVSLRRHIAVALPNSVTRQPPPHQRLRSNAIAFAGRTNWFERQLDVATKPGIGLAASAPAELPAAIRTYE